MNCKLDERKVYALGLNERGSLGLGDNVTRYFVQELAFPDFVLPTNMSHFSYSSFLIQEIKESEGISETRVFGNNLNGEAGVGNGTQYLLPVENVFFKGAFQIASGFEHTLILYEDRTLKACGRNLFGQFGVSYFRDKQFFPTIVKLQNNIEISQVYAGGYHSMLLLSGNKIRKAFKTKSKIPFLFWFKDNSVLSFGKNNHGQLGTGNNIEYRNPQPVSIISNVKEICLGSYHSLFLLSDGRVFSVGNNNFGQLGLSDFLPRNIPTQIPNLVNIKQISCGMDSSFFLTEDGNVLSCGKNSEGELCQGFVSASISTPSPVLKESNEIVGKMYTGGSFSYFQFGKKKKKEIFLI